MTASDATYAAVLSRNAAAFRERPALLDGSACVTHGDLEQRAARLARALAGLGVGAGDRIVVLSESRRETIELLGAAACLGACVVMLNVRWSDCEIARVIQDADPRIVFADAPLEHLLALVPPHVRCHAFGARAGRLSGWDELNLSGEAAASVSDGGLALLGIPTAAVEGRPRIALLSQSALVHQAELVSSAWALDAEDRYLCVLPLYHTAALVLALTAQIRGGATVIQASFDPPAAAASIERDRITVLGSFAPMLSSILDAADAQALGLRSLRVVIGLEPPEALQRLRDRCPQAAFWGTYGQTETTGFATMAPASDRPGAAGRPLPGVRLSIESPDGTWARPGESGEIVLQGPCIFSGYWRRPDETAHAGRGGWHHTGDLGRLDQDGFLWYVGRTADKELIKSGGENVYPAEVEAVLIAHPDVEDAVVFGVTDARWGEAVRAVCVLKTNRKVIGRELIDFVGNRIARYKRPREVVFVDAVPRLPDGRIDRAAVRARHSVEPA
jgi:long-chain acyl-CoA synthetase